MSGPGGLDGLAARIVAVHEMLDSMRVTHQFDGAVALGTPIDAAAVLRWIEGILGESSEQHARLSDLLMAKS